MELQERVYDLEAILASFIRQSEQNSKQAAADTASLKQEMKEFKQEMSEFKEEMRLYRESSAQEMKAFKEEMRLYREKSAQEMKEFKEEMSEFKEESRLDRKKLFREWGHLSNKLGSVAEDIAAPGVIGILRRHFGVEVNRMMHTGYQRNVKDPSKEKEIDVIALTDDYFVLCEIKTTIREKYVDNFIRLKNGEIYDYFPEYRNKQLIPIFSSFDMPENLVKRLTDNNILSMVMGDDHMVLANPELVNYFTK